MLHIDGLAKRFASQLVLSGIELAIPDGSFWSVLGPSGCGKSTLLRCIAGLEKLDSGDLRVDGRSLTNLPPNRRNISFAFQSGVCFAHWNVEKNLRCEATAIPPDLWDQVITQLEIGSLLRKRPDQLSGGELQRVSLGRTLLSDAKIWLLDEPIAQLNPRLRFLARELIRKLHQARKPTILYVTHDLQEAMSLSDEIVVIDKGKVNVIASPKRLFPLTTDTSLDTAAIQPGSYDSTEPNRMQPDVVMELLGVPANRLCIVKGKWIAPHRWLVHSQSTSLDVLASKGLESVIHSPTVAPKTPSGSGWQAAVIRCTPQQTFWELDLRFDSSWSDTSEDGLVTYRPLDITIHIFDSPWMPNWLRTFLEKATGEKLDGNQLVIEPF